MPDEEQTEASADDATLEEADGPVISGYGVASAGLGALTVAAIVLGWFIWSAHRSDVDERGYQSRAMQAAVDWTGLLINMNTDNIAASLQRLHDGTVGELNADFDSAIQPYQQVVQRLQSRSRGEVEAVALEVGVATSRTGCPGIVRVAISPAGPLRLSNCRLRSPAAPTRSWWWPPRSARTPAASRRPCTGTCGWGFPTWTAS